MVPQKQGIVDMSQAFIWYGMVPQKQGIVDLSQGFIWHGMVPQKQGIVDLSQGFIWHGMVPQKQGFKFTPTPKSNITELRSDIKQFHRCLRLREYFGSENIGDESIVRNKSEFTPPKDRDEHLGLFINTIDRRYNS
ncbi:hypothetical protein FSP39_001053 [Pinctada imbricata]|uniref:Uncharacterized protein n=1 Tax=Pinctada imbricata TaxID=66713 RepID=A0AA88XC50_PINIB|nr:hypothetical protein FSP39_001053 [Pinctada imbricata]